MHAHARQAFDVLHRAQVLGVHDVSAVFVLERWHQFIGAIGFLQQEHLIGGRAQPQRWLWLEGLDDLAELVFGGLLR
ncbi:hypothetical protein D3C81_1994020 [compost metagenome]